MGSTGLPIETTLDPMEEERFRKKHIRKIQQLAKELDFSFTDMECIFLIYYKIQKNAGEGATAVSKNQLPSIFHSGFDMTDPEAVRRTTQELFKSSGPHVTLEEWARTMGLFLRGTFEEKANYCYKCYTNWGYEGELSRNIMFLLMQNSIVTAGKDEDSEEVVKDLIEVLQKKLDVDRDGHVSKDDFIRAVRQQPLLLECLGQCLPSRLAVHSILTSFTEDIRKC